MNTGGTSTSFVLDKDAGKYLRQALCLKRFCRFFLSAGSVTPCQLSSLHCISEESSRQYWAIGAPDMPSHAKELREGVELFRNPSGGQRWGKIGLESPRLTCFNVYVLDLSCVWNPSLQAINAYFRAICFSNLWRLSAASALRASADSVNQDELFKGQSSSGTVRINTIKKQDELVWK